MHRDEDIICSTAGVLGKMSASLAAYHATRNPWQGKAPAPSIRSPHELIAFDHLARRGIRGAGDIELGLQFHRALRAAGLQHRGLHAGALHDGRTAWRPAAADVPLTT